MAGRSLELRWVLANMAGSSLGFGVFAVLAHGLVSPHDEVHPTLAQVSAHTLGLLPAGVIIALGQQFALKHHSHLARWFTVGMSLSMTIAFLVGAYGVRPPFDFLFAYAAVGAVLELALRPRDRINLRKAVGRAAVTGSCLRPARSLACWHSVWWQGPSGFVWGSPVKMLCAI